MARNLWDLSFNQKSRRWHLTAPENIKPEQLPTLEELKTRTAEHKIHPRTLLSDDVLERSLEKARNMPGEAISFPVVLEPTFDVRISVAPEKTSATLYIRKSDDPKNPIDLKLISTVLNNSRLVGMNPEKIQAAIAEFKDSDNMELANLVLAQGTPPGRGNEREFVPLFEPLPDEQKNVLLKRLIDARNTRASASNKPQVALNSETVLAPVEKGVVVFSFSPIEPGTPGIDVYGKEIPGLPGNDPFIHLHGGLSLGPSGVKTEREGLLITSGTGHELRAEVVSCKHAEAAISVSEDKMTAFLKITPEIGAGTPLDIELVKQAISKESIKGSLNFEALEKDIQTARNLRKSLDIILLSGLPAVKPNGVRLAWKKHPGSADKPALINAGDEIVITETLPAGSDGVDVFGTVTPANQAQETREPDHDESILKEPHGQGFRYAAATGGLLVQHEGKLKVSKQWRIDGDVAEENGDIAFPGDIEIAGNVGNGRSVRAGGDLQVFGNAEVALISADESVRMQGGIKGKGRGTVWAKKEIHLQYAENSRILAGGNISIDNYCFQCTVKTNGKIIMQGNPAVLLGGNIRASQGLEVFELGSSKTIRTSISFGQNYLVSDQIEVCEREVVKIKETIDKIDAEMKRTANTNPRIHELRRTKLELMKRNDKLTVRIFTLKEQFETHIISSIRVENTVYPGVILESHGRYHEVREQKNHVIFYFDLATGQIICKPIENE
ncbi:MAG TPA: FapA family protein [Treponemataceae bacterium]|nr:FapA family protein [Treponemataceae bacterium]